VGSGTAAALPNRTNLLSHATTPPTENQQLHDSQATIKQPSDLLQADHG